MVAGYQNNPGTVQQEAGFGFLGNLWMESNIDGITASATQTQAGATQLQMMINRVTTVASPGNAVRLPSALPGLEVCVINEGANQMTVFGSGSDIINGVAGATGISQMPNSASYYVCSKAGAWSAPGAGVGYMGNFPTYSTQTGITATPGGTQANSVKVTASQVQISVCATLNDSMTLPPAVAGMEITIINNGAASAKIWPASAGQGGVSGGDTINALAQNAGFTPLAAGTPTIFYCFVLGTWITK